MTTDTHDERRERRSFWQALAACAGTEADRRNQLRFLALLFAWAVSFVAVTWILKSDHGLQPVWAWSLALSPNLFTVAALLAYLRFLRQADELVRRIQLDGLAVGFGAGVILTLGYHTLERVGAPVLAADNTIFVMMMGWVVGQLASTWHYR